MFSAKRSNVALALASIDGVVVASGETLSFWRCVGRPTRRAGYGAAAAIKSGVLTQDVGGAICLVSTLIYNVGLLAGLAVDERRCHSVDSYGARRYFELGRDAAVEHPYIDLRLRNVLDVPVRFSARIEGDRVVGEAWAAAPLDLAVTIEVAAPASIRVPARVVFDPRLAPGARLVVDPGADGARVTTRRIVRYAGSAYADDLGESVHMAQATVERIGPLLAPPGADC